MSFFFLPIYEDDGFIAVRFSFKKAFTLVIIKSEDLLWTWIHTF